LRGKTLSKTSVFLCVNFKPTILSYLDPTRC